MITLTNVTKSYVSKKKKQRVDALKGVSFELGNTGMVFILGKSGSGKSTLLNMLGGLDSPTSGEIVVDGVSMKDFKQADYDGYRNGYVGFIFQEFNLLDEFNVKDNVALALRLSKGDNIDERVVTALKQVELTEDYLTRRIDEMSGGEKQRVAIARTIVKESKMILADEPTGNLDSSTGESIWNILKKLSQTQLVVVVSHDRESAEKYGDRVIEIADGNVIADSASQKVDNGVKETFTPQKKNLSFLTCLKMGVNSLFQRKVRSICVLLLAILSITALIITQLCLTYSADLTIAKFIQKYDVNYFVISDERVPRKEDLAFLKENSAYIKTNTYEGFIRGKQDILDMGWSFVGEAAELDHDSYYVSSNDLQHTREWLDDPNSHSQDRYFYLDENDERVYINESPSSWEFLIGKRAYLGWVDQAYPPVVAGIVDVSSVNDLAKDYVPDIFVLESFSKSSIYFNVNLNENDGLLDFGGGKRYSGSITLSDSYYRYSEKVITESGIVNPNEVTVGEGEIVLTYELLAALFNVKSELDYVVKRYNTYVLRDTPEQIGQTYPIALYDENGELIVDFGELKIVGVACNLIGEQELVGQVNKETLKDYLPQVLEYFLINTSSVGNVRKFVANLGEHSTHVSKAGAINYITSSSTRDCAELADWFTEYIDSFTIIIGSVSLIMILILILLVTNLISLSITGRKKEIGILSALGTSNKDIAKIFIFETLVIALITFIMVLIASFIFGAVFNRFYSQSYYQVALSVPFFNVDILTMVTLTVASFGLLLLGAALPLIKISKLKPIDAIRNV